MPNKVTPDDERVLYEAGYLLLQKGNIKAAREVFEGLVAMFPEKGLPHTFLGNTYFADSKFDEAVKHHRKAVELSPNSAISWAHLGESLLVTQKKEEAATALKKVIAIDSKGPAAEMANALLDVIKKS